MVLSNTNDFQKDQIGREIGATTPGQSEPGNNGNKYAPYTPQIFQLEPYNKMQLNIIPGHSIFFFFFERGDFLIPSRSNSQPILSLFNKANVLLRSDFNIYFEAKTLNGFKKTISILPLDNNSSSFFNQKISDIPYCQPRILKWNNDLFLCHTK